ncbi:MAG: ABC transporter ATP-binding protein [Vicinamibacterales bacterium]
MATLRAEGITVRFGAPPHDVRPLTSVDAAFTSGDMTLVRGPSGSGKSTLLAVLGALLTANSGRVFLDALCVSDLGDAARARYRMRHVGFVFQGFQLFGTMSALENVMLPMQMTGVVTSRARARAAELLDRFGLASRLALRPKQLSGGEQQRVALARALSVDPTILLADEPTASLDGDAGHVVASLLQTTARTLGKVVVTISHDERLIPFANRVITLADGRIASDTRSA